VSGNPTSFRLPSAYTIPTSIEHEGKNIPLPSQIRDNVRMLFNGLLDAHQAIVSLNDKLAGAGGTTVVNNNTTNTTVITPSGGLVISTPGQGYMVGPGFLSVPVGLQIASNSNITLADTNVLWAWQFNLDVTITISKVSVFLGGGTGVGNASVAIYDASGNQVLYSGLYDTSINFVSTNTIAPVTLTPGIYYFGQTQSVFSAGYSSFVAVTQVMRLLFNAVNMRFGNVNLATVGGVCPTSIALPLILAIDTINPIMAMFEP